MSDLHSLEAFKRLALPHHLALHIGFVSMKQLAPIFAYFGSFEAALEATESQWRQTNILTDSQLKKLLGEDRQALVDEALNWGEAANQSWLPLGSPFYPELLTSIDDAPLMLSARGSAALLADPQIAIVGSRHASKQGVNTAKDFAQYLSSQGLTITSGLALGIDAAAHQGGLAGMGKTIAVVATGLDRIYPAANQTLGRQIAEE
ncbi:MAG: DNA-processing protein DprA, partial [Gammaproteobacteria bacterium]|nr:DNA-processing protein DprA [Gammaproteobacteria bacterium]